jgi:UDP-galactopyranose mutase|tara:strand:- start:33 stop:317 length:285 start_codon:yes stop_codon:yes gene_type:complete
MNLNDFTKYYFFLILTIPLFYSCSEEDICTKKVNVPIWNEKEQIFEDNFQEFPCDFNGITKSISKFTGNEKIELMLNFKNKNTSKILERNKRKH